MIPLRLIAALLSLALCAAAAAQTTSAPANEASVLSPEYQELNSKSIFSRTRQLPFTGDMKGGAPQSDTKTRAPYFVGAMKDEIGVAGVLEVFDDKGISSVVRIHAGDPIAWGDARVESITLDTMLIATPAGMREIPLGADLNKQPVPMPTAEPNSLRTMPLAPRTVPRIDPSTVRQPRNQQMPAFGPGQQRPRQRGSVGGAGGLGNEPLAE